LFLAFVLSVQNSHAQSCAEALTKLFPSKRFSLVSRLALSATLATGLIFGVDAIAKDPSTLRIDNPKTEREIKIAAIGDSLTLGFELGSKPQMIWEMRNDRIGGWFNDINPSPHSPKSVVERLAEKYDVSASNYARVSAQVENTNLPDFPLQRAVGRVDYLEKQIENIINQNHLPKIVLVWIGHNNMDWIYSDRDGIQTPSEIQTQSFLIAQKTIEQLMKLKSALEQRGSKEKMAVIVYGLADFESFFVGREKAGAAHSSDPTQFPYFYTGLSTFPSLRETSVDGLEPPIHGITRLADQFNLQLQNQISSLAWSEGEQFRMIYSDALHSVDFSDPLKISQKDAWHPSALGHDLLAEAAILDLTETLNWLER
jgi:hypothetical protein